MNKQAIFIFYTKDKKILLQHRTKDAPRYPDYWGFFGGGIDTGETPDQAVTREAYEELGISFTDIPLFKTYTMQQEDGMYEKHIYIAPLPYTLQKLREQQKEGVDLGLFSLEEISNLKFNKHNLVIIEDLKKTL